MLRFKYVYLVFVISLLSIALTPQTSLADTGGYITDFIQVDASVEGDKLNLECLVLEGLQDSENMYGLFLALPKNQSGVWTDYKLISAERSSQVNLNKNYLVPIIF